MKTVIPQSLTVYAQKHGRAVAIYRDPLATNFICRFPSDHSNKPTRRNKFVTLNCSRWNLVWI